MRMRGISPPLVALFDQAGIPLQLPSAVPLAHRSYQAFPRVTKDFHFNGHPGTFWGVQGMEIPCSGSESVTTAISNQSTNLSAVPDASHRKL